MPKVKAKELRTLSEEELLEKYQGLKKELFDLRVALKLGKLEKHGRIRELKRHIARVLTVLNETKREATQGKGKETQ